MSEYCANCQETYQYPASGQRCPKCLSRLIDSRREMENRIADLETQLAAIEANTWDEAEKMLREEVPCRCDEAYLRIGRIAPDCFHYTHGMFSEMAKKARAL